MTIRSIGALLCGAALVLATQTDLAQAATTVKSSKSNTSDRTAGGGFKNGGGTGGGGFMGRGRVKGGGGFMGGGPMGLGGMQQSDIRTKHDVQLLGRLDNGLGFYRFSYKGSDKAYVGVMAQEVQTVMPNAVVRGSDGFLRVYYGRLGLTMQSYDDWVAAGEKLPAISTSIRQ